MFIAVALVAGCTHIGPHSVATDRFNYSTAIADSWKQQTLLNIVKMRYLDMPVFLDVSSIVAGYSLQTGVTIGGVVSSERAVQGDYAAANAQGLFTDRPTITYLPMTGDKFLRGLLTPIDPRNIFFLLQAGYPADFILGLTVESLNGVRNRAAAGGVLREADPDFIRALQLLRDVQVAGGVAMRIEEGKEKLPTLLLTRHADLPADVQEKSTELRRLLKLDPDLQRFVLIYSPLRGADDQLAVNSRSMLQILQAFASYVDVPPAHIEAGWATPLVANGSEEQDNGHIRSSATQPTDAFVAVQYRGYWFSVDNSDQRAKRALTSVMLFFTLTDTGSADRLPIVTIPAQ